MTTITNQGSPFAGLSGTNSGQPAGSIKGDLGQKDFLKLMTTQLQNQDPFAPMENGEFLGQMAQFSTVSGIEKLNTTLAQIGDQIGQFRIATASSLLGQEVLVPGNLARPDADGRISGAVELAEAADVVTVAFSDARNGALLHTQTLGAQAAGMVGFEWKDVPAAVRDGDRPVQISVSATANGKTEAVGPAVFARVMSVTMAPGSTDYSLDVRDQGTVPGNTIMGLR